MKYSVRSTKQFRKDFERIKSQGKDLVKLHKIVLSLQDGEQLEKSLRNHSLRGEYDDCMECHISPDWLLIYRIEGNEMVLLRTGSHSELFK